MIRKLFRRSFELVAVRHVRLDAETRLSPGDPLPERVRLFQRMSLYSRRLVGEKNDPWTLALIPAVAPKAEGEKPEADGEAAE